MSGLARIIRSREKRTSKSWQNAADQFMEDLLLKKSRELYSAYRTVMEDTYDRRVADRMSHEDVKSWCKVAKNLELAQIYNNPTAHQFIDVVIAYYRFHSPQLGPTLLVSSASVQIWKQDLGKRSRQAAALIKEEVNGVFSLCDVLQKTSNVRSYIKDLNLNPVSLYIINKKLRLHLPNMRACAARIDNDYGRIDNLNNLVDSLLKADVVCQIED